MTQKENGLLELDKARHVYAIRNNISCSLLHCVYLTVEEAKKVCQVYNDEINEVEGLMAPPAYTIELLAVVGTVNN